MSESFLTPEVESLIQGYVEGELTASECTRLRDLLEASPGLITPILANLQTDMLVRQAVLQLAGVDLTSGDVARAESMAAPKSKGFPRFAIGFAVASLMIVVALGAMIIGPGKIWRLLTEAIYPVRTGSILYEYWDGIPGNSVSNLTLHPNFQ